MNLTNFFFTRSIGPESCLPEYPSNIKVNPFGVACFSPAEHWSRSCFSYLKDNCTRDQRRRQRGWILVDRISDLSTFRLVLPRHPVHVTLQNSQACARTCFMIWSASGNNFARISGHARYCGRVAFRNHIFRSAIVIQSLPTVASQWCFKQEMAWLGSFSFFCHNLINF
jgi:hypothetical protein